MPSYQSVHQSVYGLERYLRAVRRLARRVTTVTTSTVHSDGSAQEVYVHPNSDGTTTMVTVSLSPPAEEGTVTVTGLQYVTIFNKRALWNAAIAIGTLIWDAIKWKGVSAQLRLKVGPNRQAFGVVPPEILGKTFIAVEVANVGGRKTELTHVVCYHYRSWWDSVRRKAAKTFMIDHPSLAHRFPCSLEPGECWLCGIEQNAELEEMARNGLLYVGVHHSASKYEPLRRVRLMLESTKPA